MVGDGRRWWVCGLAGMVVLGWLAGCLSGPAPGDQDGPVRQGRSSEGRAALERKIGQMVLVGFRGMSVDDAGPVVEQIRAGQVGGVVLFDVDVLTGEPVRNVRSPDQVQSLVDGLQRAAGGSLLVAVDQEGGRVTRLKERYGFPPTRSQRESAQRGMTATREQAAQTARTLSQLGINVNLAPVVDLNVNPESPAIGALDRSFSADAQVVSEHAWAVTWSEAELDPYRALIGNGMVDMVMTAHVFNRNIDPEWPATLSPSTITGLLRQRLGFNGVVVADDMQMGAVAEHYGLETALRQAIVAGVDIITFANNNPRVYEPDIAPRAINIIAAMVEDGTISETRIDESVARIRALKQRLSR